MKKRGQQVFSVEERIKRNCVVDPVTKCWNWTGSLRNGYGRMITGSRSDGTRKSMSAHVASYIAFKRDISAGFIVCHSCDNKKCVNPQHLWLGTKKQNTLDMMNKGRWANGTHRHAPKKSQEGGE